MLSCPCRSSSQRLPYFPRCLSAVALVGHVVDAGGLPPSELRSSVSFEDARRAVAEAKHHAKAKAVAVLKEHSRTWADKLAAVRSERQQLAAQLQQLRQQRDDLAAEVRSTAADLGGIPGVVLLHRGQQSCCPAVNS